MELCQCTMLLCARWWCNVVTLHAIEVFSQLSYESIMFANLMHGPTLWYDVELTREHILVLNNLMVEQEDAQIARGWWSPTTELVNDNCVIVSLPPMATPESSIVVPSTLASLIPSESTPIHLDANPPTSACAIKSLREIMKLQQLTLLITLATYILSNIQKK